jgi:hypothetical protein
MPRLHLVTGHRTINRSDAPLLIYLGHDADAAKTAQADAITKGLALIVERYNPTGPVTRYSDKKDLQPLPVAEPAKADEPVIEEAAAPAIEEAAELLVAEEAATPKAKKAK